MYVSSANPTHLEACTYASAFSNVALFKPAPVTCNSQATVGGPRCANVPPAKSEMQLCLPWTSSRVLALLEICPSSSQMRRQYRLTSASACN